VGNGRLPPLGEIRLFAWLKPSDQKGAFSLVRIDVVHRSTGSRLTGMVLSLIRVPESGLSD
jgi:hypothetical protein